MDDLGQYRALRQDGRLGDALALARRSIPNMEASAVAQLGRLLAKDLATSDAPRQQVSVRLVGQCTTTFLQPFLTAWAWAAGVNVTVSEAAYDQVVQELIALREAPDVIVLLPWHQRLLAHDARPADERVADEMTFLHAAWAQIDRLKCKLVQIAYDWSGPGALGYTLSARRGGGVALVDQANHALRTALPAGAYFVDLAAIGGWHGKAGFYDERNYFWFKQPFSAGGLNALARHLAAGVRLLTRGRNKVLVLDLDDTLWGGVVGEAGPHGIVIGGAGEGEAFVAFQSFAKRLRESGVLLAVCSKNNEADAREPFETNDAMALKLDDFAAFHASWDPKPSRVRLIAHELNLGLESFVFFDDNPAERERMRAELPEVTVIDVPADPSGYVRALQESLAFETIDLTEADAGRAAQYTAETARRQAQTTAAAPGEYLSSLDMRADVDHLTEANLDRVVDLITKTNQFNLTTRRHSRPTVEAMTALPRSLCFAVRLLDKFGDYGIVAVILALPTDRTTLHLDTWLMSCRAMGRTVEHFTLNHLAAAARQAGFATLTAEYLPTPKNIPVQTLLPDCGFRSPSGPGDHWSLDLADSEPLPTPVQASA